MCLSVSSVWAQDATTTTKKVQSIASDATPAASLTPGYYVIKVFTKKHDGYVYFKGNNVTGASNNVLFVKRSVSTDTISSNGSLAFVWYVTPSSDGKLISMQCAGNGGFFPYEEANITKINRAKTLANATAYYYSEAYAKGVFFNQANYKNLYIHCNGDNEAAEYSIGYWTGAGDTDGQGSATLFNFYAVTLEDGVTTPAVTDVANITYKRKIADTYESPVVESVRVAAVGSQTANPWTEYSDGLYEAPTLSVASVTANTGDVDVNFAEKDYVKTDTYYRLFVPRTKNNYNVHVYSTINTTETSSKNNFTEYYNPQAFWKFEKDGLQVKMVCADGTYVKATQPGNGLNTAVTFVTDPSQASKFYLKGKPSGYSGANGFSLKFSNNTYLGDHSNWHLGVWNSNNTESSINEGSCFVIEDTFLPHEVYENLSHRATFVGGDPTTDPSLLRVYTTDSKAEFIAALNAANDNVYGLTISDVLEIYKKGFAAHPDVNAYYRIKNLGTGSNIYPSTINIEANKEGVVPNTGDDNARVIVLNTESDAMAPQLWQFVANEDGTFKIKNANTKCAWANKTATGENFDMPIEENTDANAGNFNIVAVPEKSQQVGETIASVNDRVSTFLLCNGRSAVKSTGSNLQLAASNVTFSNAENYWQIEKVENFDVAISDAKYATVGYPFNVKVTNKDVRVYYAKSAVNGVMKLTEATNQIIPANEGAILYYEGEGSTTANLEIVSEAGEGFVDNILTASTAKRTGFATKTTYGLSNKDGVVSFRLNTDTYVPANKSYLLASNYSNTTAGGSAQQLLFSFDNVVEGIDNAVVDGQNANKVYYDLQGRRVMYPAHGIFVTENGEKVFIK